MIATTSNRAGGCGMPYRERYSLAALVSWCRLTLLTWSSGVGSCVGPGFDLDEDEGLAVLGDDVPILRPLARRANGYTAT